MQVTTELRGMFSYSLLFIIFILVVLIILFFKTKTKKEIINEVIIPNKKDINLIKNKYLTKINELLVDLSNGKISSRKAYQNLSALIRNFIFEVTNIKVQNYTLKDIKSVNIPQLYNLVSEYYDPEFAKISKGNITESINKTKEVISKWH